MCLENIPLTSHSQTWGREAKGERALGGMLKRKGVGNKGFEYEKLGYTVQSERYQFSVYFITSWKALMSLLGLSIHYLYAAAHMPANPEEEEKPVPAETC